MLPHENDSAPKKGKSFNPLPIFALLLVVAGVSWWIGRSSHSQTADDEKTSPPQETVADPQLAPTDTETTEAELEARLSMDDSSEEVGGVAIETEPAGATIQLTHQDKGTERTQTSPATILNLPAGFYDVVISQPGYRDSRSTYEVIPNRIREMEKVVLQQGKGSLVVKTVEPAKFELAMEKNPGEFEVVRSGVLPGAIEDLVPSAYRLAVLREGWPPVYEYVTVKHGEATEVIPEFTTGSLTVASQPEGVEVLIRAQGTQPYRKLGITPFGPISLPIGVYELTLKPDSGPPKSSVIQIQQGIETKQEEEWIQKMVSLTSDPPGASIYLNSQKVIGTKNPVTPMTMELQEGLHKLTAVWEGLDSVTEEIRVGSDSPTAPIHFEFDYGALTVSSEPPDAEVFLGATKVGTTPLVLTELKPGNYQVRVRKERFGTKTVSGRVLSGDRLDLAVELNYDPNPDPGEDFTNSVGLKMIWVNAINGWACATEMTQGAWVQLEDENPSAFGDPERPMENISWGAAHKYCEKLTLADRGKGLLPVGYRYNLPTDAQWTLLAADATAEQAVTSQGVRRDRTMTVGSLPANSLGLYDMRGNVWEWCLDWYTQDVYSREQSENASGQADRVGTLYKIMRGGSWNRSMDGNLSVGYRLLGDPNNLRNYETGFRVVLIPIGASLAP